MRRRLLTLLLLLVAAVPAAMPAAMAQEAAWESARTFAEKGFGYTLTYPGTWSSDRPGDFALVLRPPAELSGGPVTVSIENVRQPDDGGVMGGIDALAERYLAEVRDRATQVEVHRQVPFRWDVGGGTVLVGQQIVADFTRDGLPYRQWAVFLPSPLGPVAHVWLYTAPQSLFGEWRTTAEDILRSLRPAPPK